MATNVNTIPLFAITVLIAVALVIPNNVTAADQDTEGRNGFGQFFDKVTGGIKEAGNAVNGGLNDMNKGLGNLGKLRTDQDLSEKKYLVAIPDGSGGVTWGACNEGGSIQMLTQDQVSRVLPNNPGRQETLYHGKAGTVTMEKYSVLELQ